MEPVTTGLTVAAVLGMLKGLLATKAGETAVEKIGGAMWDRLASAVRGRGSEADKAKAALSEVEAAPSDEDWQAILAKQLQSLAATDADLRKLLEELAADAGHGGMPSIVQTTIIKDEAKVRTNIGVIGPGSTLRIDAGRDEPE